MSQKEKYLKLLPASLPLFHRPFWLDAVCYGNWDVALIEKDGRVEASLPYCFNTVGNTMYIDMPMLTQFLGPWIAPADLKPSSRITREMELLSELERLLPDVNGYRQRWQSKMNNWLPFYWKGYSQTTRYTYVIADTSDLQKVSADFNSNVKRNIKKAEKELQLMMEQQDAGELHRLMSLTYIRQGRSVPYDAEFLGRIVTAVNDNNDGKVIFACNAKKQIVAGALFAWDDETVYYIGGGFDNAETDAGGAMNLLLWSGIKLASETKRSFDFEGSMIPGIENFFRGFGGEQRTFFQVSRGRSTRMMRFKKGARMMLGAVLNGSIPQGSE